MAGEVKEYIYTDYNELYFTICVYAVTAASRGEAAYRWLHSNLNEGRKTEGVELLKIITIEDLIERRNK